MKVTAEFLQAKKSKGLNNFVIHNHKNFDGKRTPTIRLILEERTKSGIKVPFEVETETEFKINNYGTGEIESVVFSEMVYGELNHIRTFLNAIKKDSDIKIEIVANNTSQFYKENNIVAHQFYGIIDNKNKYFLSSYVGPDNSVNPINKRGNY